MSNAKSDLSLKDLEQFRDEEGYIDLDKAGLVVDEASRETRGNADRFKHWVDFNGTEALVKQGSLVEDYGMYSQLIMVELAKQLGLPVAEYDLIKFKGKKGALTPKFGDPENAPFESVYDLIGDPPLLEGYEDICDYVKIENLLEKALDNFKDMTEEEKATVIRERRKQKIFQAFACENDGHTGNEGVFLTKTEDGRTVATIAPMFDTETSFLLDNTKEDLELMLSNNETDELTREVLEQYLEEYRKSRKTGTPVNTKSIMFFGMIKSGLKEKKDQLMDSALADETLGKLSREEKVKIGERDFEQFLGEILDGDASFRNFVRGAMPKSAFAPTEEIKEEFGDSYDYASLADSTLALLRDLADGDEELEDFMYQINDLDMEAAIEAVEEKIKAPVPEIVKKVAIPAFEMRKRDLSSIMSYERICQETEKEASIIHSRVVGREQVKKNQPMANDFLAQLISRSIKENVSFEEGLGALHELADVTKTKEEHTQAKTDKDKNEIDE